MAKDERLQISISKEDRERLESLAAINTGENMSFLIRRLIREAWENPQKFGLQPAANKTSGEQAE